MARGSIPALEHAFASTIEALGYEFVGCEVVPQGSQALLRIYIDAPDGIKISDCEKVSRQIGSLLDVEDPFNNNYILEVSSPGLDRPLFVLEHYKRFVGHKVRIKLRLARNGQRNFQGILQAIENDTITLQLENAELLTIAFEDVEKGQLQAEI